VKGGAQQNFNIKLNIKLANNNECLIKNFDLCDFIIFKTLAVWGDTSYGEFIRMQMRSYVIGPNLHSI